MQARALLIVVSVITAACSGGGAATTTSEQETSTTSTTSTTQPEQTTTTADTSAGGEGGSVFGSAECAAITAAMGQAVGVVPGSIPDASDLDPAEQLEKFAEAAEAAPEEIRDDMQVLVEGLRNFHEALAETGIDLTDPSTFTSAESLAVLEAASESLQTEEFGEASINVTAFFAEICG